MTVTVSSSPSTKTHQKSELGARHVGRARLSPQINQRGFFLGDRAGVRPVESIVRRSEPFLRTDDRAKIQAVLWLVVAPNAITSPVATHPPTRPILRTMPARVARFRWCDACARSVIPSSLVTSVRCSGVIGGVPIFVLIAQSPRPRGQSHFR